MDGRKRACPEQFVTMINFMERNGDLNRQLSGLGRLRAELLWRELAHALNAAPDAVRKPVLKWKRVWADWKSKTKKKAAGLRAGSPQARLTALEQRVLALMAKSAVRQSPPPAREAISQVQDEVLREVVQQGLENPEELLGAGGGVVLARAAPAQAPGDGDQLGDDGDLLADGDSPAAVVNGDKILDMKEEFRGMMTKCTEAVLFKDKTSPYPHKKEEARSAERGTEGALERYPGGGDVLLEVPALEGTLAAAADGDGHIVNVVIEGERLLPRYGAPAQPPAAARGSGGLPAEFLLATRGESPLLMMSSDAEDSQAEADEAAAKLTAVHSPGPKTPRSSPRLPSSLSSRRTSFADLEVRRIRLEREKEAAFHEREIERLRAEASRNEYLRGLVELARSLLTALVAKVNQ